MKKMVCEYVYLLIEKLLRQEVLKEKEINFFNLIKINPTLSRYLKRLNRLQFFIGSLPWLSLLEVLQTNLWLTEKKQLRAESYFFKFIYSTIKDIYFSVFNTPP